MLKFFFIFFCAKKCREVKSLLNTLFEDFFQLSLSNSK